MKKLIFALILIIAFVSGCKKEVSPTFLTGHTYSSYTAPEPGDSRLNMGFNFISGDRAMKLLLNGKTDIVAQEEVAYSGSYPNMVIGGLPAVFSDENTFVIQSITMSKWR